MPHYRSRPVTVQAFKHADPKGVVPEPFASMSGLTATSGQMKIGKDAVGQLLVPSAGIILTARIGDYVVLTAEGDLNVVRGADFEANYDLLDGQDVGAVKVEGDPAPAEDAPQA